MLSPMPSRYSSFGNGSDHEPSTLTDDGARARLVGLSIACPLDQGNPSGCPLHDVRKKDLVERIAWVKHLNRDEIDNMIKSHESCLAEKERKVPRR